MNYTGRMWEGGGGQDGVEWGGGSGTTVILKKIKKKEYKVQPAVYSLLSTWILGLYLWPLLAEMDTVGSFESAVIWPQGQSSEHPQGNGMCVKGMGLLKGSS